MLQENISRYHKVKTLFPGAVAPYHVLEALELVEPMQAVQDTQFFIGNPAGVSLWACGSIEFCYLSLLDVLLILAL